MGFVEPASAGDRRGAQLSSYTVAGIQNNQETITYTVYNEQADPETRRPADDHARSPA